jgi:hypothetical protein
MAYTDDYGIDFENLPSTTTPLTAANLNKLQNDLADYADSVFVSTPYIPNDPDVGEIVFYSHPSTDHPWLMRFSHTVGTSPVYNVWSVLTPSTKVIDGGSTVVSTIPSTNLSPAITFPFPGKYDVSLKIIASSGANNQALNYGLSINPSTARIINSLHLPISTLAYSTYDNGTFNIAVSDPLTASIVATSIISSSINIISFQVGYLPRLIHVEKT